MKHHENQINQHEIAVLGSIAAVFTPEQLAEANTKFAAAELLARRAADDHGAARRFVAAGDSRALEAAALRAEALAILAPTPAAPLPA